MPKRADIINKKFGRLKVVKFDRIHRGRSFWICQCSCGNKRSITASSLLRHATISCGCYRKEMAPRNVKRINHGVFGIRFYKKYMHNFNQ